jgi:hypothetical protein
MKINRETLADHPMVQRLLANPNWKPAAEAAMDYFLDGTECPIASWRKSSTWSQVKFAFEKLNASSNPKPPSA